MIDKLYDYDKGLKIKPRTYRRSLDKEFLSYSKKKIERKSAHRKMKRKLLESVNINFVTKMLPSTTEIHFGKEYPLTKKELDLFEIIKLAYAQQKKMYDEKMNSCKDRIASIFQAHVTNIKG